ncbi:hypothetical protein [Sphingomonas sp. Marseille-Q8236]
MRRPGRMAAMTRDQPKVPRRPDPIVAVGLLTQRDLDVLGSGFRRSFPVEEDAAFDDLLRALDSIEGIKLPGKPG